MEKYVVHKINLLPSRDPTTIDLLEIKRNIEEEHKTKKIDLVKELSQINGDVMFLTFKVEIKKKKKKGLKNIN